jgi:hypothetical protein
MYKELNDAKYINTPLLLEDECGVYTLRRETPWNWPFGDISYSKAYQDGPSVYLTEEEYTELKEEAELLWGKLDWAGDWVPGLLRRELPIVNPPDFDQCAQNPSFCPA